MKLNLLYLFNTLTHARCFHEWRLFRGKFNFAEDSLIFRHFRNPVDIFETSTYSLIRNTRVDKKLIVFHLIFQTAGNQKRFEYTKEEETSVHKILPDMSHTETLCMSLRKILQSIHCKPLDKLNLLLKNLNFNVIIIHLLYYFCTCFWK